MKGPGKYDSLATHCRMVAGARGVVVAIIDGERAVAAQEARLQPGDIT